MSVHDTLARLASEDPAGLDRLEAAVRAEASDPRRQGSLQVAARERLLARIGAGRQMFGRQAV